MNKKILYTVAAVLIVIVTAGLVIWKVRQKTEQPILPDGAQIEIVADPAGAGVLIQGEELDEYAKLLDQIDFGDLNAELQEVDGLVEQLQP